MNFYNELAQWVVLGLMLYRVIRIESCVRMILDFFTGLNKLLDTIKDELNDDDEQN